MSLMQFWGQRIANCNNVLKLAGISLMNAQMFMVGEGFEVVGMGQSLKTTSGQKMKNNFKQNKSLGRKFTFCVSSLP